MKGVERGEGRGEGEGRGGKACKRTGKDDRDEPEKYLSAKGKWGSLFHAWALLLNDCDKRKKRRTKRKCKCR